MLNITGYSDQISVAPGDAIKFMVNCEHRAYQADIVRIVSGDLNPEGPGIIEEAITTPVNGRYKGRKQKIYAGSYAIVPSSAPLETLESFTVQVMVWPSTPLKGVQALVSKWSARKKSGFALMIDASGGVAFMVGNGKGKVDTVAIGKPMVENEWYLAAASYNAKTREMTVLQEPMVEYPTIDDVGAAKKKAAVAPAMNDAPLMMASCYNGDTPRGDAAIGAAYFNGKLDSPAIVAGVLDRAEISMILAGNAPTTLKQRTLGRWDFSRDITETTITDISSHRLHGKIVHMPTRGVIGYNWTGEELNWKHAPEQYGAIKFHDDDVYDAGWDVDFELTIPDSMKSGIYAAHLLAGKEREDEEYIPFVVRPKPGKEKKVCFLFPITSYKAYANEHFATDPWPAEIMTHRAVELDKHHIFLNEHREYGHSLYDRHSDGSGVHISSRLRPVLNMRPKAQTMLGGDGSQLWQFNADTHLTVWLEKMGYDYDVITDEDVHHGGTDVLKPYDVVLTGSHPEYYSKSMFDAVFDYTHQGGRLMYMGGNGFYWRVSYHDTAPGVIELRRSEGGSRAWAPKSGEYYTGFTGEYSGLWRRQGRAGPNVMAGVGFSAEGFDISTYYRRNPDSFNSRVKFMFKGIRKNELIGDFGLIGGGAAGLEVDRMEREFGTPPHALCVASSENHTDTYLVVVEDILFNLPGVGGQENEFVRGDLCFFETPNGGAVFSVSSMAWVGSLPSNDFDNNVSMLTKNVLDRFADPKPFPINKAPAPAMKDSYTWRVKGSTPN